MKILNAKICSNGHIFDGEVKVDGERIASVMPKETSSSADETIIAMAVWDMILVMPQRKLLTK